jgi:hypothetical protein
MTRRFEIRPGLTVRKTRTVRGAYLILNLFFTASRNRKISAALNGACTKVSTMLAPSG